MRLRESHKLPHKTATGQPNTPCEEICRGTLPHYRGQSKLTRAVFRGCYALYSHLSGGILVRSGTTGFDVGLPYKTVGGQPTSPCGPLCQPPVATSKPTASTFLNRFQIWHSVIKALVFGTNDREYVPPDYYSAIVLVLLLFQLNHSIRQPMLYSLWQLNMKSALNK